MLNISQIIQVSIINELYHLIVKFEMFVLWKEVFPIGYVLLHCSSRYLLTHFNDLQHIANSLRVLTIFIQFSQAQVISVAHSILMLLINIEASHFMASRHRYQVSTTSSYDCEVLYFHSYLCILL